jgi:hypothetical protein
VDATPRPAVPAAALQAACCIQGGFERLGQARPVDAALVERVRRAGRDLGEFERGQIEKALDLLG